MSKDFSGFYKGIRLRPIDSGPNPAVSNPSDNIEGSLWVYQNKLKAYISSAIRDVLFADLAQTITNKTISSSLVNLGAATNTNKLVVSKALRSTINALVRESGSVYYATDEQAYYGDNGSELISLGSSGLYKVDLFNPISTALPMGISAVVDGVTVVDGDTVAFSNLSSGNNKIYQVSGVGSGLVWTAVKAFKNSSESPEDGDLIVIQRGTGFADQIAKFTGSSWQVNDTVRYFDGANYWEQSSIKKLEITNNTTDNVFQVSVSSNENFIVDYSISRGLSKETGQIIVTSDGTDAAIAQHAAAITSTGVSFVADVNSGNIRLRYTTDNSGADGTITYSVKRWANGTGGPGGVPDYNTSSGSTTAAAGAVGEIQFHGTDGNLAAESDLSWNQTDNELGLGTLRISKLQGALTINDNQASAATILSYPWAASKFSIFEYSIERNNECRVGRLLITTNGTVVSITDDSTDTGGTGISSLEVQFSAQISGADVLLRYVSNSTGFSGSFKYSSRKWS